MLTKKADSYATPNHFYVFVSYEGHIGDPEISPNAWVVPAARLRPLLRQYRTRTVVSRKAVRDMGKQYANAWWRLVGRE